MGEGGGRASPLSLSSLPSLPSSPPTGAFAKASVTAGAAACPTRVATTPPGARRGRQATAFTSAGTAMPARGGRAGGWRSEWQTLGDSGFRMGDLVAGLLGKLGCLLEATGFCDPRGQPDPVGRLKRSRESGRIAEQHFIATNSIYTMQVCKYVSPTEARQHPGAPPYAAPAQVVRRGIGGVHMRPSSEPVGTSRRVSDRWRPRDASPRPVRGCFSCLEQLRHQRCLLESFPLTTLPRRHGCVCGLHALCGFGPGLW